MACRLATTPTRLLGDQCSIPGQMRFAPCLDPETLDYTCFAMLCLHDLACQAAVIICAVWTAVKSRGTVWGPFLGCRTGRGDEVVAASPFTVPFLAPGSHGSCWEVSQESLQACVGEARGDEGENNMGKLTMKLAPCRSETETCTVRTRLLQPSAPHPHPSKPGGGGLGLLEFGV